MDYSFISAIARKILADNGYYTDDVESNTADGVMVYRAERDRYTIICFPYGSEAPIYSSLMF